MALQDTSSLVRLSKIADRYLIFDADDAAFIRRRHNLCGVLVGSTPQNPTQNLFLSLPLELFPEEAALLLENNVAILIDEVGAHTEFLRNRKCSHRAKYVQEQRDRNRRARKVLAEDLIAREAHRRSKGKEGSIRTGCPGDIEVDPSASAQESANFNDASIQSEQPHINLVVTPTTSLGLGPLDANARSGIRVEHVPACNAFHRHLLSRGYFTTPGLRFGAKYSVYPGDPLRYHAHFLATNHGWDEEIPVLDMVGSGRLGTSVKKGYLIAGADPRTTGTDTQASVRAFSIEWAGM